MKTPSYALSLARRIGLSLCLLTLNVTVLPPLKAQSISAQDLQVEGSRTVTVAAAQSRDSALTDKPTKSIPLDQLGAEAQKQYSGDGLSVVATPSGAWLRCIFQRMEGQATREGLWLTSTADVAAGERFRVRAMAVGREGGPMASLPEVGNVRTNAGSAWWERAGLAEEYSVSMDGVRQDFIVPSAPIGSGALRVQLEVSGAVVAPVSGGAKLKLTGSGRAIAYSRLRVTDATGRVLESRMEAADDHLVVVVADAGAAYPIRIDPTFSDADWVSLNPSIASTNGAVYAFATGPGGILYAGGAFTLMGGVAAKRVAKWDGTTWSPLGDGMDNNVYALTVDYKTGDLYAGGAFHNAGGVAANHIAKWNGAAWSAMRQGVNDIVLCLAMYLDDLYVGGSFTTADGTTASHLASWHLGYWWQVGNGTFEGTDDTVRALTADYTTYRLYIGGDFIKAGGAITNHIAGWDAGEWVKLGTGVNDDVYALGVAADGLYAGGVFTTAGGVAASSIAKWNGKVWTALGAGINAKVYSLEVDLNNNLYAGGVFSMAGGLAANRIAKWNGILWQTLGSGMSGTDPDYVRALKIVADGSLYAGGSFTSAGGKYSAFLALAKLPSLSVVAEPYTEGSYLEGSVIDFEGVNLSAGGLAKTFTISNTGTADLILESVTTSGGNTSNFVLNTTGMVTTLAPAASTTFIVTFTPSALGKHSTALHIRSNDGDENTFDLVLSGTGISPEMVVLGNGTTIVDGDTTPQVADHTSFGSAVAASGSIIRTFTIANTGSDWLDFTGEPSVQITGPHSADFTVTTQPSPYINWWGEQTSFSITFAPSNQGLRTATVSIANNDSNENPYNFAISGTGVGLTQTITFGTLPNRYQAEGSFPIIASASSGLPVAFSIASGPATLIGNVLTPAGPGAVKVRATQPGNASYKPATAVERTFTVLAPAKLTLVDLSQIYSATPCPIRAVKGGVYVDASFAYGATNEVTPPTLVGSYPVKAVFGSEMVTGKLVITKAPLQVIPDNQSKFAGQANPALTLAYSGFLGSDMAAGVVSKTPALTTTATATSPGGLYPITASGGTSANYSFVYQKGSLEVKTFAGLYEALLEEPMDGNPAAKLEINVAATSKSFTGKITTPTETSAIALAGPLTTNVAAETASGSATVTRGTGVAAATYVATFTLPLIGDFTATATRNGLPIGSSSEGKRLLVLPRGQTLSHAGAHTMRLAPAVALVPTMSAIPAGAGYATATINATTGSLALSGKLADGTPFTATLAADADAGYRLFAVPYTGRINSYLAGWLDLTPHPNLAGRRFISSASKTNLAWSKLGNARDTSYRGGFGILGTAVTLDPWLAPTETSPLPHRLGLIGNDIFAEHSPIEGEPTPGSEYDLPYEINLSTKNVISVAVPLENLTKWRMTIVPSTGIFTGSFIISGTPNRTVPFAGALRQPPNTETGIVVIGDAHYLLPANLESSTNESHSGEILLEGIRH